MIKNNFIVAWRNIRKNRVSTLLNVSGLAIGVAVCLLIGIWLYRETSFDAFHPDKDRVYRVTNTFKSESETFSQAPSGPAFGAQLPHEVSAIESSCRYFKDRRKVKGGVNEYFEPEVLIVDSNFFRFFGFPVLAGDSIRALNDPRKMVMTRSLAKKYFGGSSALGQTVVVDGKYPMTVAAVAEDPPANSHIQFSMLLPVSFLKQEMQGLDIDTLWLGGWPYNYVKLLPGADLETTEVQVNRVARAHEQAAWDRNKISYTYHLQPLGKIHLGSGLRYDAKNNGSSSNLVFFATAGLVILLLACINYINLATADAIRRARETAVRKVVGAVKRQLLGQYFLETALLCFVAVTFGVALLKLSLPVFSSWMEQTYTFSLTFRTVTLLLAFIVAITGLAGIYPSYLLASFRPTEAMKGDLAAGPKGKSLRMGLVTLQFSMTIVLLSCILLMTRQMNFVSKKGLGYSSDAVIEIDYNGDSTVTGHYGFIRNELMKNPNIRSISRHGQNVVGGVGNGWTTTTDLAGKEISTSLYAFSVDTSYLQTYGMELAAGRWFSKDILSDTLSAAIVNEAAVRRFGWQKPENALGKTFGKGDNLRYVIGVVKDFNFESLHKPIEALMIRYVRGGYRLSLRLDKDHVADAIGSLETRWKTLVPGVPLNYAFVDSQLARQYGNEQKMTRIFYTFSALSLLISCLGLFGLSRFVVRRRIREIGVRKVLGASVPRIIGMLSADFALLVVVSFLFGTPIAWWAMHNWLESFAYRTPIAGWVFVLSGGIAMVVALLTISFEAFRVALANPVKSLRTQ